MKSFNLEKELNPQQYLAASTHYGPILVIAGAGSGKTRMLTFRIASMLASGIDESEILALTFTNKAAREMAERVRSLTGEKLERLTTSTFHSFGMGILKQYIQYLGYRNNFTIYDSRDKQSLLHEVVVNLNDNPDRYQFREIESLFSDIKTRRKPMPESGTKLYRLFIEYRKTMKAYNALDFDDLITLPLTLFEKKPKILGKLRNRYRYILVDEFQDTSLCQYLMVSALAAEHRNLCCVGDDDQSIYSWRGANYKNLLMFEKEFPERKEIKLEENYRSTGTILNAANSLINHNTKRKKKKLWTRGQTGSSIQIIHPANESWEAKNFCTRITREMTKNPSLTYNDFAVLVRTNRLMDPILEQFEEEGIPVNISGGPNLLERKEVRDILAYLKLITNTDDDINFLRVINTPLRGIGRVTIEKMRKVADTFHCSLFDAAYRCAISPDKSINQGTKDSIKRFCALIEEFTDRFKSSRNKAAELSALVSRIGYKTYLEEQFPSSPKMVQYKMGGIRILIKKLTGFQRKNPGAPLIRFLNLLSLDTSDDQNQYGTVDVMTIHAAKGLEWDTVFLSAVEEAFIPSPRALEEDPANLAEERRLFYVAITRAKRNLIISSAVRRTKGKQEILSVPSRFLKEIPDSLLSEEDPDRQLSSNEINDALGELKARLQALSN